MKKSLFLSLLAATTISASSASAIVCLSPEPITCAITALVIAGGIAHDLNGHPVEIVSLQSTSDQAEIQAIAAAVRADKSLMFHMASYYQYSPGFDDVISRFQEGKISGRLSLESMMDFNPRLFADLDKVDSIIRSQVKQSEMPQVRSQWERYAVLAAEAKLIYQNTFAVQQ